MAFTGGGHGALGLPYVSFYRSRYDQAWSMCEYCGWNGREWSGFLGMVGSLDTYIWLDRGHAEES